MESVLDLFAQNPILKPKLPTSASPRLPRDRVRVQGEAYSLHVFGVERPGDAEGPDGIKDGDDGDFLAFPGLFRGVRGLVRLEDLPS